MVKVLKGIPPETHLAPLISTFMIRITNTVTYFSFIVTVSAYTNFTYVSSKNLDGDREGRGYKSC
jgi:hypothetical protein